MSVPLNPSGGRSSCSRSALSLLAPFFLSLLAEATLMLRLRWLSQVFSSFSYGAIRAKSSRVIRRQEAQPNASTRRPGKGPSLHRCDITWRRTKDSAPLKVVGGWRRRSGWCRIEIVCKGHTQSQLHCAGPSEANRYVEIGWDSHPTLPGPCKCVNAAGRRRWNPTGPCKRYARPTLSNGNSLGTSLELLEELGPTA